MKSLFQNYDKMEFFKIRSLEWPDKSFVLFTTGAVLYNISPSDILALNWFFCTSGGTLWSRSWVTVWVLLQVCYHVNYTWGTSKRGYASLKFLLQNINFPQAYLEFKTQGIVLNPNYRITEPPRLMRKYTCELEIGCLPKEEATCLMFEKGGVVEVSDPLSPLT